MKIVLMSLLISSTSLAIVATPLNSDGGGASTLLVCPRGTHAESAGQFFDTAAGFFKRFETQMTQLKVQKPLFREAVLGSKVKQYLNSRIRSLAVFESALCLNRLGVLETPESGNEMMGRARRCDEEAIQYGITVSMRQMLEDRAIELSESHKDRFLQALDSESRGTFVNSWIARTGDGCL